MSNFNDIVEMHQRYGFDHGGEPRLLDMTPTHDGPSAYSFRFDFMQEELDEFAEAHEEGDLAGAADALIDLVVVAMGTAVMMGLPWQVLWDDVHRANMSKERGQTSRGVGFDLVKPEGWKPPMTELLLETYRIARQRVPPSWVNPNPTTEQLFGGRRLATWSQKCPECGEVNVDLSSSLIEQCRACGSELEI
jgi:predicted HAD superfamily Cof-like phosphohydrolase